MQAVTLRAHFDGERICLNEPYELEPNERLIVIVASKRQEDMTQENDERQYWLALTQQVLQNAYSEDEPEYTLSMLREVNPDYAGG